MMSPQLIGIRRQLVESRIVIADTRRNVVVNSSEIGFNAVLYRSASISCYIVATRTLLVATRAMSPCFARRR